MQRRMKLARASFWESSAETTYLRRAVESEIKGGTKNAYAYKRWIAGEVRCHLRIRKPFPATLIVVSSLLFLPSVATADGVENPMPRPNVELHSYRRIFFVESTALAVSSSFDWTTTVHCIERGCHEIASRWVLGPRPSDPAIARFALTCFVPQATALYFTERSHHSWVRWAGRAYAAYSIRGHFLAGFHNRRFCQPMGACGPGR